MLVGACIVTELAGEACIAIIYCPYLVLLCCLLFSFYFTGTAYESNQLNPANLSIVAMSIERVDWFSIYQLLDWVNEWNKIRVEKNQIVQIL